jgi:DNA-binding NarL/FixJ family response regulator
VTPSHHGGGQDLARPADLGLAPMRQRSPRATIRDVARTVLIVDDHEGFRRTARELLEADGFEVLGEAADGETAIAGVGRLRPRLVLLDIRLPDIDGFEVAERLAQSADPPTVVLTSSRDASVYRRRLALSPARAFIPKSELSGDTLAALLA